MKKNLALVVTSTGPSGEIDRQRAERGAREYWQDPSRREVLLCGNLDYSGDWSPSKYISTQSGKMYRILRQQDVPREKITIDPHSFNTFDKVINSVRIASEKNAKKIIFTSDEDHAKRYKTIFDERKKKNRIPQSLELETKSSGIDRSYGRIKATVALIKDYIASKLI